jgi:predicted nucleotidyltransferase component of viral defense system
VCWTLNRIFTPADPPAGLLFKGSTSLSKVFGVIERFSEDVDLSFDRAGLGFGGESDLFNATTGKKRKHARTLSLIHVSPYTANRLQYSVSIVAQAEGHVMPQEIRLVDRGRGLRLSTSRITVHRVLLR